MADEFVTEIKQVVADPVAGPRLNDLLNAETGRLIAALGADEFGLGVPLSDEGVPWVYESPSLFAQDCSWTRIVRTARDGDTPMEY